MLRATLPLQIFNWYIVLGLTSIEIWLLVSGLTHHASLLWLSWTLLRTVIFVPVFVTGYNYAAIWINGKAERRMLKSSS